MATPESNPLDAASPLVSSQTLAVAAGSALRKKYTKELYLLRLAENRAKRGIKLVRAKLEVLNDFERKISEVKHVRLRPTDHGPESDRKTTMQNSPESVANPQAPALSPNARGVPMPTENQKPDNT